MMRLCVVTAVLSFCSSVTCIADSNDGQRSGPPQPIGIDFGLSEVYAVYAHGPDNVTTIGAVRNTPSRTYPQYMYNLYELYNQGRSVRISTSVALDEDNATHESEQASNPKLVPKDDFISSVVHVLEDVKHTSITFYNITITSAVVSLPDWMNQEESNLVKEACSLAGIELLEWPMSRIDLAAKTAEDKGHDFVLILELTQYELSLYHRSLKSSATWGYSSMRIQSLGASLIHAALVERTFKNFNDYSVTGEILTWTHGHSRMKDVNAAFKADLKLRYGDFWDDELDFGSRTVDINLTDSSGQLREFPISGNDIIENGQEFTSLATEYIETFLWNHKGISAYLPGFQRSDGSSITRKQHMAMIRDMIKTVPAPPGLTSWTKPVDGLVILDSTWNDHLLLNAAEAVLGEKFNANAYCGRPRPVLTAAVGASMKALEWVGSWEEGQKWMRFREEEQRYRQGE